MTSAKPLPGIGRSSTAAASGGQGSGCAGCASATEPDLQSAVANLSRKLTELSDVVGRYMADAGLDRKTRAAGAAEMAQEIARITGGFPTQAGAFPECALIGRKNAHNGLVDWFCTGVLVHPRVVLTAAHCQNPGAGINVVALKALSIQNLSPAELLEVKQVRVNPLWPATIGHDISVLVLRKAATVAPVPIATTAEIAAANRTTLAGFGNSDLHSTTGFGTQREVTVDITNVRRDPSDDLDDAEQALGFESDLEFTAGGNGFDSCNGDSGGPAYIETNGGRRVAGLTSRATAGFVTPCGDGGIYTRVDTQRSFIESVMKEAKIKGGL